MLFDDGEPGDISFEEFSSAKELADVNASSDVGLGQAPIWYRREAYFVQVGVL